MPSWFRVLVLEKIGRVVLGSCTMQQYWNEFFRNVQSSAEDESVADKDECVRLVNLPKAPYENHRECTAFRPKSDRCEYKENTWNDQIRVQQPRSIEVDSQMNLCHFNQRRNSTSVDEMLQWQAWSHLQRTKSIMDRRSIRIKRQHSVIQEDDENEKEYKIDETNEKERINIEGSSQKTMGRELTRESQQEINDRASVKENGKESPKRMSILNFLTDGEVSDYSAVDLKLAEWKLAALIIDKVFMYVFLIMITMTALIIFCQAPVNREINIQE